MPEDINFLDSRPALWIDGEEARDLYSSLISVLVEETTAGLFRCEIRLSNIHPTSLRQGYLFFDRDIVDFGRQLTVKMTTDSAAVYEIFQGRIMALEGEYPADAAPQIVVLAEDRLQDLRMTRRSRRFEYMTDGSIITQVAEDHGLQVMSLLNTIQTAHEVVVQANQSDLAFIRERARRINALLRLEGDTLTLIEGPGAQADAPLLRYRQQLKTFRVLADLAQQRTQLHVTGWDAGNKEPIDATAGNDAVQAELLGGISGSAILYDVIGEREDYVVHQAPLSQAEAQASSISRYLEGARSFVRGSGSASGDARIRAGLPLDLRGLGKLFDGLYYVTRVQHRFDRQQGYRTDFDVERPAIGRLYDDDADDEGPYVGTITDDDAPDSIEVAQPGLGELRDTSKADKERKS